METFSHYELIEKISESRGARLFRARDTGDGRSVILKFLLLTGYGQNERVRLRHEFSIISKIEWPGIVKTLDIVEDGDRMALVLEDFSGVPLNSLIKINSFKTERFLQIGISLAATLGVLHRNGIIHRDIKPQNILVNTKNFQVKVADFGISTRYTLGDRNRGNSFEGTLQYISPEQSGRISQPVDYRTDFYSLGVTFFEMMTGSLPFTAEDPLELIHSHLAKPVPRPSDITEGIPEILSDIVVKLMAKNAEDRYSDAIGIEADLLRCLKEFKETGTISRFTPGEFDRQTRLVMPHRIAGRKTEEEQLLRAISSISSEGPKFIIVSGEPGIGKSALVSSLFRPVAERGGFFTSGRFDAFRQGVPFSSIVQAVQNLLKQILVHDDDYIEQWSRRLSEAVGANGRVITDVIPVAAHLLGKHPPSPELDPEETKNRFNYTLKNFIKAFASPLRPLVIFFDDLQWIDRGSVGFIQSLLSDRSAGNILVIGTCRFGEINESHPLHEVTAHLESIGNPTSVINLEPINQDAIFEILSCVLHRSDPETIEMAEIIHEKTRGNPFFINQFIQSLFELEIIVNDPARGWVWEPSAVRDMVMTSNVIEYMAKRISQLPEFSRRVLTSASCIGDRFDIFTLSVISGRPIQDLISDMGGFVSAGYLKMSDDEYYFQHDRIHEAAYSILTENERMELHLKIGRMELDSLSEEGIRDKIFYITGQLNRGIPAITEKWEIRRLADLNRRAGDRARESSAFDSAMRYYEFAVDLLENDLWQKDYSFAYILHLELAECAYLSGEFQKARSGFESVFSKANNDYDRAMVCNKMAVLFTSMGHPLEAVRVGLKGLKLLGVNIPEKCGRPRVLRGVLSFALLMINRKVEDFYTLPLMEDKKQILVMHLLNNTGIPGYYVSPNLFAVMAFKAVKISFRHGNSEHSAFAYMALGSIISTAFGKHHAAFRLGLIALRLNEKYDNIRYRCKNNFSFAFFIQPWIKHVKENYGYLENGYRFGIESGDHHFCGHCVNNLYFHKLFAGVNLDEAYAVYNERVDFLKGLKDLFLYNNFVDNRQLFLALKGESSQPHSLDSGDYSEADRERKLKDTSNLMERFTFLLSKIKLLYFNRRFTEGLELSVTLSRIVDAPLGSLYLPEFYFYHSLLAAAAASSLSGSDRSRAMKTLKRGIRFFKRVARFNESNFLHKYLLLKAENKRLAGKGEEACDLYIKAMRQARLSGFTQDKGIICETAADYYYSIGHGETGDFYLSKAYDSYKKWGALLKLKIIRELNPRVADAAEIKGRSISSDTLYSTGGGNDRLDLSTVIKASQAISGEIHVDKLLETLMKIILENAGAEKGALIFEREDGLYVEAAGDTTGEVAIEQIRLTADAGFLPVSLINYVGKTGEILTLDDAANDPLFQNEKYIFERKIRSILCFSFALSGGSSSILYLENSLVRGAFTADRVKLLSIIMSQAAISIENARLVSIEKQNAALEKEISMAREIQSGLLPRELPGTDKFSAAYRYIPMMGVGGDFISMRYLPDRDLLGLFLCDVSGHGVPAAITATMISMSLDFVWEARMDAPGEVLTSLRSLLYGKMAGNFFTAAICVIDFKKKILVSCNAGHPPMIILRKIGKPEFIRSKGRMINEIFEPAFEEAETRLHPGDRIFIYTDGVTEVEDSSGKMIGGDDNEFIMWADSLSRSAQSPEIFCKKIIESMLSHTERKNLDDDVAVIAVDII